MVEAAEHHQLPCIIKSVVVGALFSDLSADFGANPVRVRKAQREDVAEVAVR